MSPVDVPRRRGSGFLADPIISVHRHCIIIIIINIINIRRFFSHYVAASERARVIFLSFSAEERHRFTLSIM